MSEPREAATGLLSDLQGSSPGEAVLLPGVHLDTESQPGYDEAKALYGEDAAQQAVLDYLEGRGEILARAKLVAQVERRYYYRQGRPCEQRYPRILVPLEKANIGRPAEQLQRVIARQLLSRLPESEVRRHLPPSGPPGPHL